ncbi:MAG: hypothetical protein KDC98_17235, partial [Planctomycetes bacterium]|nr:hypothetical protein [Planctomycetota bacterium]
MTLPRRCLLWSTWLWLAGLILGAVILVLPEPDKNVLIADDPWEAASGFFHNAEPGLSEVSAEISREAVCYQRSWEPQHGASTGYARTRPFRLPRFVAIPYAGYPSESGITLCLERRDSGERLRIARGNAHENWVERTLWLPGDWVGAEARLVAESSSKVFYIAVGTPHSSSLSAWLKESLFVVLLIHALGFLLLLAPGAAIVSLLPAGPLLSLPRSAWILPLSCALGYGTFFLFYYAPAIAGTVATVAGIAALLTLPLRRRRLRELLVADRHAEPLIALFLISLVYVLLLYSADDGLGSWAATYRFSPAAWSSDNQLSQQVADAILWQRPLNGLLGPWHVSDRPPLLSGVLLAHHELWQPILALWNNARLQFYCHQITGIIASTFWVLPLALLCRRRRGLAGLAPWMIGLCATTGFFTFHSLYIWPKLLAGALGLCAFACLLTKACDGPPRPGWR